MNSYQPGVVVDANERRFGGLSWVSAASGWMLLLTVTIARQFLRLLVPRFHWHKPLQIAPLF